MTDPIHALIATGQRFQKELDRLLKPLGTQPVTFNYARYRLLDYIAQHPGRARADIAHALELRQATITETITQWLEGGLLLEDADGREGHRLKRYLVLSDRGTELLAEAKDIVAAVGDCLRTKMGTDKVTVLADLLHSASSTLPVRGRWELARPYERKKKSKKRSRA